MAVPSKQRQYQARVSPQLASSSQGATTAAMAASAAHTAEVTKDAGREAGDASTSPSIPHALPSSAPCFGSSYADLDGCCTQQAGCAQATAAAMSSALPLTSHISMAAPAGLQTKAQPLGSAAQPLGSAAAAAVVGAAVNQQAGQVESSACVNVAGAAAGCGRANSKSTAAAAGEPGSQWQQRDPAIAPAAAAGMVLEGAEGSLSASQPAGSSSVQQQLAGVAVEADKAGCTHASPPAVPPLPATAAATLSQQLRTQATAAGDLLDLCCLDKLQSVTGEEYSLRVAGYINKGGNATVWEVEKLKHGLCSTSSSSSRRQGEPPDRMALKLSYRYCDLNMEQQAALTEEMLVQANAIIMAGEYSIYADCASCFHVTKCYGWGLVKLPGGMQLHGMLLELSTLGSLDKLLVQNGGPCGLDAVRAHSFVFRVNLALQELHSEGKAIHRDLKPSNVLLFGESVERARVKLSDFGSSKQLFSMDSVGMSVRVGTLIYHPPELREGCSHDSRMDTWLLGLLLLELRTGFPPFWYLDMVCKSEEEVQARRGPDEVDNPESPYFSLKPWEKAFVKECLVLDYRMRPTVKDLRHTSDYFKRR